MRKQTKLKNSTKTKCQENLNTSKIHPISKNTRIDKAHETAIKILNQHDLIEVQMRNFQADVAYDIVDELVKIGIIK